MGEQTRVEDWLPEGWKVEIRVRKSGKKDRYYTDPASGYIFRSRKDIDRYLLTGKLGRHVSKTKPKDSVSSDDKLGAQPLPGVSKEKKSLNASGLKKSCPASQGHNLAGNAAKSEDIRSQNSKEVTKTKICRPTEGRSSRPSRKRESTPFFILDSDQCEEGVGAVSIPNLSEIIDSMRKEKEGRNTLYVSAPAIGALLGGQLSKTGAKQNENNKPHFALGMYSNSIKPDSLPCMASKCHVKSHNSGSKNIISSRQDLSPPVKHSRIVEAPGSMLFGDLLTDPCFDFAVKTLTGAIPLGSETSVEDGYFWDQLGSSMIKREGSSCQN